MENNQLGECFGVRASGVPSNHSKDVINVSHEAKVALRVVHVEKYEKIINRAVELVLEVHADADSIAQPDFQGSPLGRLRSV